MSTDIRVCNYCGTEGDDSMIGYHSGSWECQPCWDWRKLDGPAARHWAKVTTEFLSNVDMHDVMTFLPAAVGNKEKAYTMIEAARDLMYYSRGMIAMSSRQRNDRQGPRTEGSD